MKSQLSYHNSSQPVVIPQGTVRTAGTTRFPSPITKRVIERAHFKMRREIARLEAYGRTGSISVEMFEDIVARAAKADQAD